MHSSNDLPTHPTLRHPLTGRPLCAVGVVAGKTVWPILGGNGEGSGDAGSGNGDGGKGGGSGDDGKGSDGDGAKGGSYTPPASQAELDRIVQDRISRVQKQYGMTPEEAKAAKERAEKLDYDLSSEKDKAVADARKEEREKLLGEATPRLVRAEFRAEAKGVLSADQLNALLEDLDLSKYVDSHGEVDVDKVAKKVAAFAPSGGSGGSGAGGTGSSSRSRNLGQGNRQSAGSQPGDQGRAMAQKRFGDKARQS